METKKSFWEKDVARQKLTLELLEAGVQATISKTVKEQNGMDKIELIVEVIRNAKMMLEFAEQSYQEEKEKENE